MNNSVNYKMLYDDLRFLNRLYTTTYKTLIKNQYKLEEISQ